MPFTFSHPFVVLPFCGKKNRLFSATGLITGSMALDFEYFIYMKKIEHESFHTLPGGVFIFGLPMGLLLMFVYHLLVRDTLINHLPPFLRKRLNRFKQLDWLDYFRQNYLKVIISLLLGIYSHLLLDGFTHDFGPIVRWLPLLKQPFSIAGNTQFVYDWLQAGLSIMGGGVILFVLLTLEPEEEKRMLTVNYFNYWARFVLFFAVVMACRFLLDTRHNKPVDVLIAGIAGALIALLLASLPGRQRLINQAQ